MLREERATPMDRWSGPLLGGRSRAELPGRVSKEAKGIADHLTCFLRNLYAGQEATIELDMEQETGSKYKKSLSRLYIVTLLI